MKTAGHRVPRLARRLAMAGAAALAAVVAAPIAAGASGATVSTVGYRGETIQVPASWPVYDLGRTPSVCARFNRHAVYLGTSAPSACPASAIGLASAVQLQPLVDLPSLTAVDALKPETVNGQQALVGGRPLVDHRLVAAFPTTGTVLTISFRSSLAEARQILDSVHTSGVAVASSAASASRTSAPGTTASPSLRPMALTSAGAATQAATGVAVYQGKGFDTCYAPSESAMAAWKAHSPFGAAGVYIGGINAACTNISASWVQHETAAGWHLFPIYVGLQAPCVNASSLATMSWTPSTAWSQGVAAANDAIGRAKGFAMPQGTTIELDLEPWNSGSTSCNAATKGFIWGWTHELHKFGFGSGVYAGLYTGMRPAVTSLAGTRGAPDTIYFAYWDGVDTTSSSLLSSSTWTNHQRIKQYNGNVSPTYGGVTISIDEDALDAPTVAAAGPSQPPSLGLSPARAPAGITVAITGKGFQAGATSVHFGQVKATSVKVISASKLDAIVPAQPPASVPVSVTTPAGTTPAATRPMFSYVPFSGIASDLATNGYWVASAAGHLEAFSAPFYGSRQGLVSSRVVGVAATATGYLMATAGGNVYNYHTPWYGSKAGAKLPSPVVGISATSTGYLLVTATGNVYNFHTHWYGSMVGHKLKAPVVGITATSTGYLVTTSRGNIYNFHTPWYGSPAHITIPSKVVGLAATPTGYLATTQKGNVYNYHAAFWGSEAHAALTSPVAGIATTSAGYLLVTRAGNVFAFHTTASGSPAARH